MLVIQRAISVKSPSLLGVIWYQIFRTFYYELLFSLVVRNAENGNDTKMRHRSIVNAYCILAAIFFAACAYAQLNDPDPVLWILGYLFGGCVLNGLVMIMMNYYSGGTGSEARDTNITRSPQYRTVCDSLLYVFLLLNTVAILSTRNCDVFNTKD